MASLVIVGITSLLPIDGALARETHSSVVRDDLAPKSRTKGARVPLLSFVLVSDLHQGDEELTLPSRTNWRNWAALAPHMVNAQVKAINEIDAKGSPTLGLPVSAVFSLGDSSDNAQYNETRWAIDLLDGKKLVSGNSGGAGYDVRTERDSVAMGRLRSPVPGQRILDLANQPFLAEGLHASDGTPIPWYAVHGNHNTKVMGHIPHDDPAWRKAAADWATGDVRIFNLNARLAGELSRIREKAPEREVAFWMKTFTNAGTAPASVGDVRIVPADNDRRILSKQEWIDEFARTTGAPKGHGFLPADRRCPDAYDDTFARRACFSVDIGTFRFIALDDSALDGFTTGSIDRAQFEWLEHQLIASSRTYFDDAGHLVDNAGTRERYVVVLTHHTTKGIRNRGTIPGTSNELVAEDLEKLLLRFPNVILHASGHSHSNRVWSHRNKKSGTGYWEISTASIIDHPHEGRTVEIADNGDGTLSVFTAPFRPGVAADPAKIRWTDDPTDETRLGAKRRINEDWLAAAGFKAASLTPAAYRYGSAEDRVVELPMPNPHTRPLVANTAGLPVPVPVVGSLAVALLGLVVRATRRVRRGIPPSPPAPAAPRRQGRVAAGVSRFTRRAA